MEKHLSEHKPEPRISEEALVPSAIETAAPLDALDSGPANVHGYLQQFRILVMGRANAGKTTLLQRVCNTTEHPEVFDGQGNRIDATVVEGCLEQGEHVIENELVFKSNPGFVFHDSSGFEAGSEEEFDDMKKFVTERAMTRRLKKRIHAIWFCIPTTDHERMVTAAEEKFFDECNTGDVPVIVILTKCDTLHLTAINHLKNEGFSKEEAREKAGKQAENMRERLQRDIRQELGKRTFPPKDYLLVAKMNQVNTDCGPLLKTTATALNEESLKRLLISTQRTNLVLCIEYAIKGLCDILKVVEWKGTLWQKRWLQIEVLRWFPYFLLKDDLDRDDLRRLLLDRRDLLDLDLDRRLLDLRDDLRDLDDLRDRLDDLRRDLDDDLDRRDLDLDRRRDLDLDDKQIDPVLRLAAADVLDVTLVSEASTMSPTEHILTFGTNVILVAEYAYFFMDKRSISSKDVFASAAQQYYSSGIQTEMRSAIALAVEQNSNDMEQLCCAILKITMEHRMSNKLLK